MLSSQLYSCHGMFSFIFSLCLFLLPSAVPYVLFLPILLPLSTAPVWFLHHKLNNSCEQQLLKFSTLKSIAVMGRLSVSQWAVTWRTSIFLVLWHLEFRIVTGLLVERNSNNSNIFTCKCKRELCSIVFCTSLFW